MSDAKRGAFTYEYPRPALTADVVLLTQEPSPLVLLIQRKSDPFQGCWALPGGFVDQGESAEDAARRELLEETGVVIQDVAQLYTSSTPGRDPRGWTVTVAFLAWINPDQVKAKAGDDAQAVGWFELEKLPQLAFDHAMILEKAKSSIG